jgi:hypothetical protein
MAILRKIVEETAEEYHDEIGRNSVKWNKLEKELLKKYLIRKLLLENGMDSSDIDKEISEIKTRYVSLLYETRILNEMHEHFEAIQNGNHVLDLDDLEAQWLKEIRDIPK